ncbi:hypothetical protein [Flavobacterium sp. 5]|uniref:hypothetical protein n=1 Tax=Flavobacterium sp. 5 TaxID=2035199 RepID=UPI000C2CA4D6|nr:hypothetical protein [Flavobacterium sp. 5]PKB17880.1 hypothetical protein CLU82_3128 [Flavobacterium sp. 5]
MSLKKEFEKSIRKTKHFLLQRSYKNFKINYFKNNYSDTKRLILIFTLSGTHKITGGILSICTIFSVFKNLKSTHNCNVISSFLPYKKDLDYKYRNFENEMIIYNFNEIKKLFKNLDYLEIHIPDMMVIEFNKNNIKMDPFFKWITEIKEVHINILNQNDLLMPSIDHIEALKEISPNLTMTMAHQQYATIEKRNYYGMPIHLLSPWLNPVPYKKRGYSEKENLILYSPDEIQSVPNSSTITKKEIITHLKENLKHYKFIEIKNMKYDVYKDYASRSKFALTFGEGLDGFFCEPIVSGGISFAVYNEIFFTKDFENLPTLYNSFDELKEKIVDDINYFDNNENYTNYHQILNEILGKKYSFDKLKIDAKEFYLKQYDFK